MPPKKVYIKKDPISHILDRSDMYVGSKKLRKTEDYIAIKNENDDYKIIKKEIVSSPAILRIFVEILSNAIDNVERSRKAKIPCTMIKVNIDKETGETSVWNDGDIIPIEINDDEKVYNHSLIFGNLMAGSNFDDTEERIISGRNGLGSTLCNVFSKKFIVKGLDPHNKKVLEQIWTNNMRDTTEPKITDTKLKTGFTKITYFPDFKQFDLKGYTDDIINLYTKYVIDAAMLTKVKVYLNEELIPVNDLISYSKMYESPTDEKVLIKNKNAEVLVTTSDINEFQAISFVNGVYTRLGGMHVDAWSEEIFRPLVEKFNKKGKPQVNIKDIKQFFKVFIVATVVNPEFSSQDKEKLESPKLVAEVKQADINKILKWSVITEIEDIIKMKEMSVLKKSEKKKKGYTKIEGLDQANNAGGKFAHECTLILCEGLSAKTYAVAGIEKGVYGKTGRDWFGILPLRGVLLNCRNAIPSTIAKNKVITDLIQSLGLRHDLDYTDDKNYKTLSYGKVMLLTDADSVTYDSPCILKNIETSEIEIKPICEINNEIWYEDNLTLKQYSLCDKYLIWSDNGWTKIKSVMRHKVNKPIFRVLTHTGSVDVTEDHSLLSKNGKAITVKECKENKTELLHHKYIQKEYFDKNINEEYAYALGYFQADGCCTIDAKVKQKRKDGTITHSTNSKWIIDCVDIEPLEKLKLIFEKYENTKVDINKYEITQADKQCTKCFKIFGSSNELKRHMKNKTPCDELKLYFEIKKRNVSKNSFSEKSGRTHKYMLEAKGIRKDICAKYRNMFYNSLREKQLPNDILNSSVDIQKAFLEGFYAGDGDKGKRTTDRFDGEYKSQMMGLFQLLQNCGYKPSINWSEKKLNVYNILMSKDYNRPEHTIKKIIDVSEKYKNTYVYDFETENHHFHSSIGNIVVHNCDGSHISALIMNFFHALFPTLLEREEPFIISMSTPIVRVFNTKGDILFYDENRFREFAKKQTKSFKSKYYKGLGTTKIEDVPDTFGSKMIEYTTDENININMNKAFHKKYADTRKEWLENYDPNPTFSLDDEGEIVNMEISQYLNTELIKFSHSDCQRSIPSIFDGLKQSQRKVLFSVKKRNLTYNKQSLKVAQLGGYVAEHTNYHHGEQNLYDTIIKMANEFPGSNNIPLLYRDGAFGCVDPETDILLWNGNIVKAKYIKVNDELIGDDGTKRIVSKTIKGFDRMYEIEQTYGNNYKVNSQHILTLYYSGNKNIHWDSNCWRTTFYDNQSKKFITKSISVNKKTEMKNPEHIKLNFQIAKKIREEYKKGDTSYNKLSKKYNVSSRCIGRVIKNQTWSKEFDINNLYNKSQLSSEEAYSKMEKFKNFSDSTIFDMNIQDYLKLPKYIKDRIKGVSNDSIINWEYKKVPIDPYIFGMWLGDGDQNGAGFSSEDSIIVKEWVRWANYNGMSVIHSINGDNHENYHYCLRRKCKSDKRKDHLPVGFYEHSSKNCIGCKTSKIIHEACDWVYDDYIDEDVSCIGNTITNSKRSDLHPFKEILKKYNLYNNKDILDEYLINDKETRLQLLAGFIDTDGTLKKNDNGIPHFEITQCNKTHGHLLDKLEFLCKSLGFRTSINIREIIRDTGHKSILKTLNIFGYNIDIIPTKLHRKQIIEYKRKKNTYYSITVKELEKSEYVGWNIDKNQRFLLGDFTVTHNTRLVGSKDAASARYIFTKMEPLTPLIFREEDDVLLEYCVDDGDVVEPKFYLPIIPMVLVNGACGIGSGWSTNIPCYNPLDVIECVKTWLKYDGEVIIEDPDDGSTLSMLPEIKPWYRGFEGTIENDGSKFITYGIIKKDKNKVEVTELPIGMWTDKFKETCEDWLTEKQIKAMKNNSTPKKVKFLITESDDGFICNINNMKLYTYLHVSNMVLFNEKEQLKKYTTDQIINDFCKVRFEYYIKRKNHILNILEKELKHNQNKARFIQEIIDKKLNIMNVDEEIIIKELEKRGYDKELKKEPEDGEETTNGYNYLLKLQVRIFTTNKVKQLKDEILAIKNKIQNIKNTSEKQMWLNDLEEFQKEYNKWLIIMDENDNKKDKKNVVKLKKKIV